MANWDNFRTNKEKVLLILSYMKGGLAIQWAKNKYYNIMEGGFVLTALAEFEARLQASFSNPNKKRNAQHQLSTTHQGLNKTMEEFFQKFKLNHWAAGDPQDHDLYLIKLLEHNLKLNIIKTIHTQELPNMYKGWKKKDIWLDQQECHWCSMFPANNAKPCFCPCNHIHTITPGSKSGSGDNLPQVRSAYGHWQEKGPNYLL